MSKLKKVLSFVAAFTMAVAVVAPVIAKADVTVSVTKPADWNSVSFHAWTDKGDITTWPGVAMTQNGDKYTTTIKADANEKVRVIFNDGVGNSQTTNIDGLTDTNGKGEGLEAGTYDVTIGTTKNDMGHYNWTITKTGDTTAAAATTAPTTVEEEKVPAASSPKTADAMNIALAFGVAIVSAGAVVFFKKKMTA